MYNVHAHMLRPIQNTIQSYYIVMYISVHNIQNAVYISNFVSAADNMYMYRYYSCCRRINFLFFILNFEFHVLTSTTYILDCIQFSKALYFKNVKLLSTSYIKLILNLYSTYLEEKKIEFFNIL